MSCGKVISKEALVCPARMVVVVGTVSSEVSLLERLTVMFDVGAVLMVTVPLPGEAAPSVMLAGKVTDSVAESLSATATDCVPARNPGALAVITTFWVLSTLLSSGRFTVKLADAEPAAMVTVLDEGAADALSEELRFTVNADAVEPVRVTVPVRGAPPSVADEASDIESDPVKVVTKLFVLPKAPPDDAKILTPVDA